MAENISIYNGLNPLYVKDWYEKVNNNIDKRIRADSSHLREKKLEISKDINDNTTKISKLKQKKFIMNKKIVEINKVLTKLYSQKIQLQMQAFKYNMKLMSMMGKNIDVTG